LLDAYQTEVISLDELTECRGRLIEQRQALDRSAATPGCWRTSALLYATTGSASSSSYCCKAHAYSWPHAGSLGGTVNLSQTGP
jgi:hypothetical protein